MNIYYFLFFTKQIVGWLIITHRPIEICPFKFIKDGQEVTVTLQLVKYPNIGNSLEQLDWIFEHFFYNILGISDWMPRCENGCREFHIFPCFLNPNLEVMNIFEIYSYFSQTKPCLLELICNYFVSRPEESQPFFQDQVVQLSYNGTCIRIDGIDFSTTFHNKDTKPEVATLYSELRNNGKRPDFDQPLLYHIDSKNTKLWIAPQFAHLLGVKSDLTQVKDIFFSFMINKSIN